MIASGLCVAASNALTRLDEDRVTAHITSSSLFDLVGGGGGGGAVGDVVIARPNSSGFVATNTSLSMSLEVEGVVARGGGKNV